MPKEFRKRGKRSKKGDKEKEEDSYIVYAQPEEVVQRRVALGIDKSEEQQAASDSYARRAEQQQNPSAEQEGDVNGDGLIANPDPESIWPGVDPDTKAYFRQLEDKILELDEIGYSKAAAQQEPQYNEDGTEIEPDEDDRVLLLRAALNQLSGKETALAADPDCSVILERLLYSMDDFARRVLADRFMGQYALLAQDRFASHVIQTLLCLGGGETVDRERRGNIATGPIFGGGASTSSDSGELPTMTEAIIAISKEFIEELKAIVASQHGSHVIRTTLLLLSGKPLPITSFSSSATDVRGGRSKKSAKWKNRRVGEMRSFMPNQQPQSFDKGKAPENRVVPQPFVDLLQELFAGVDYVLSGGHAKESKLGAMQLRTASDDPVSGILVQILLETEADAGASSRENSVMDRLLEGLISALAANPEMQQPPRSDYIETLMRSAVSSHTLEVIFSRCPDPVYHMLFKTYLPGRVARLAGHPVANFVVKYVVERASKEEIEIVVDEIGEALSGCIENSRTGVLQTLLEKTNTTGTRREELSKMLLKAFQITKDEDMQYLLPCGLSLMTLGLFRRNASFSDPKVKAEYMMQGALLLQSWLRVPNSPVSKAILATPWERLNVMLKDPIGSRVVDVFLDEDDNPAVSFKDRRDFLKSLIGRYHELADDRIGSRVADRCWKVADPFLKDRIAQSLLSHEYTLQNSHFGHFFLRKVNLPLYKRDPREWKTRQAQNIGGTPAEMYARKAAQEREAQAQQQQKAQTPAMPEISAIEAVPAAEGGKVKKEKKKRKKEQPDEIDELFATKSSKKVKA